MKHLAGVIGTILIWLTVAAWGQNDPANPAASAEDVRRETAELLQAARAYTIHQKEEFHQKVEAKLDELTKGIVTLQSKAKRAGEERKAELNAMIADLQQKKEAARLHYEELKASSAEAWGDLKVAMETAMKDLRMGYEGARARFRT